MSSTVDEVDWLAPYLPEERQWQPGPRISDDVWDSWLPYPEVRSWNWICGNVCHPNGEKFDPEAIPWCEGVCDAFDDDRYREVGLEWATRLGKTLISMSLGCKVFATKPMPSLFGSSTEPLSTAIVREKWYPMLERCRPLRAQLKPPSRRSVYHIDLAACRCRICWSGSDTSLADYSAWFLHANEVEKWSTDASAEADPFKLFMERKKEFPDYKALVEGSPGNKRMSRIEPFVKGGTNSRLWVPCPKCGSFQVLVFGQKNPGEEGVIWDKGADDHSDATIAYETARYLCPHCRKEIHDEHRKPMMLRGVWAAEGCHVDKKGHVKGEPKRPNTNRWSSQLSSLYSLQLRWGDIAKEWVSSHRRPRERQNFVNGWLGETYEAATVLTTTEALLEQMVDELLELGMVPDNHPLITIGVDRQETHRLVVVTSWGEGERGHCLDYGVCTSDEEVYDGYIDRLYENSFGDQIRPQISLLDSGYETKATYAFCERYSRHGSLVLPCKGADNWMRGKSYEVRRRDDSALAKRLQTAALASRGDVLVHVNNSYWQETIQRWIDQAGLGQRPDLTLHAGAAGDRVFAEDLLNQARVEKLDKRGKPAYEWVKRDPNAPDDFRDALKYARAAAEAYLLRRWARIGIMLMALSKARQRRLVAAAQAAPGVQRPAQPTPAVPTVRPSPASTGRRQIRRMTIGRPRTDDDD